VVECDLAKVEVAGSNPVSRSIRLRPPKAGYGAMSRRSAEGAKADKLRSREPTPKREFRFGEPHEADSSRRARDRGYLNPRTREIGAVAKW